ncbi:hypothetical protein [Flavobacterium sp.]|uniref:hypothetical protein n=2 Tax=Flavobacterium sp. TaxID=239 RepID=UPI00404795DF
MNLNKYYIGWDVGAWNCDKNKSSRDAVVILDSNGKLIGHKRGNIRDCINNAQSTNEILQDLFHWCGLSYTNEVVVLAIDTPLGFSQGFINLITNYTTSEPIGDFSKNLYLFRKTEQFLFQKGEKPLSAVNHMIGAQATKGIHFLAKFAPKIESLGIWKSNDGKLTVIETYPSANRQIEILDELNYENQDIKDAYICAAIAKRFKENKTNFYAPLVDIHEKEGWIWVISKEYLI